MSVAGDARLARVHRFVWYSSFLYSMAVLGVHGELERHWVLGLLTVLGLVHLVVVTWGARLSRGLVLSQGFVAAAGSLAVFLHVHQVVGTAPGASGTVADFFMGEVTDALTYALFLRYTFLFCLALTLYLLLARLLSGPKALWTSWILPSACAAAAVNISWGFALARPLYHVSSYTNSKAFFFAAGIFGVGFSLPLFLVTLCIALVWLWMRRRCVKS